MQVQPGSIVQVAYVTTEIDRAITRWVDGFGAGPFYKMVVPASFGERTYRGAPAEDSFVAALGFLGNTWIELVQPTNDAPSVFQEVLQQRGDLAFHHVQPNVRPLSPSDFDSADAKYRRLGYDPSLLMVLPGMGRCTLFDARPQVGSFVELIEISPAMYRSIEVSRAAHETWDGRRPIRDFAEAMGR